MRLISAEHQSVSSSDERQQQRSHFARKASIAVTQAVGPPSRRSDHRAAEPACRRKRVPEDRAQVCPGAYAKLTRQSRNWRDARRASPTLPRPAFVSARVRAILAVVVAASVRYRQRDRWRRGCCSRACNIRSGPASTGRVELGRRSLSGVVLAIRARGESRPGDRDARRYAKQVFDSRRGRISGGHILESRAK